MPSRAKTTMKRKRRKSRLIMDFMELSRDTTRFLKEFQYLYTETYNYKAIQNRTFTDTTTQFPQHRIMSDDLLGDFEDPEQS